MILTHRNSANLSRLQPSGFQAVETHSQPQPSGLQAVETQPTSATSAERISSRRNSAYLSRLQPSGLQLQAVETQPTSANFSESANLSRLQPKVDFKSRRYSANFFSRVD